MSNITKAIAQEVAIKLTVKKRDSLKNEELKLKDDFREIIIKTIPKDVLDCFEKHPSYFDTRTSVQLSGNGFQWESINFGKELPVFRNFTPDAVTAKKIMILKNKVEDSKKNLSDLQKEIENALFGLRTYKRVEENFPEAFAFLPNKITTSLAINLTDIRQKIK